MLKKLRVLETDKYPRKSIDSFRKFGQYALYIKFTRSKLSRM